MEGSSNVIKEAMACNCPIVTTDAGDAKWVIGNTAGCYVSTFEPEDVADKIKQALSFSQKQGTTLGVSASLKSAWIRNNCNSDYQIYKKVISK